MPAAIMRWDRRRTGRPPIFAGQNIANPASQVLSAAMLLNWYGQRKGKNAFVEAATAIETALADAVAARECTKDAGGTLGTRETGAAWVKRLNKSGR